MYAYKNLLGKLKFVYVYIFYTKLVVMVIKPSILGQDQDKASGEKRSLEFWGRPNQDQKALEQNWDKNLKK